MQPCTLALALAVNEVGVRCGAELCCAVLLGGCEVRNKGDFDCELWVVSSERRDTAQH